jgi:hypothetical protein
MTASITRWLGSSALALQACLSRSAFQRKLGIDHGTLLGRLGRRTSICAWSELEAGDETALQSLLRQHVDVNAAEADAATALSWAR